MTCFLMCVHVEAELAAGLMLTVLLMLFAPFLCFWCSRPTWSVCCRAQQYQKRSDVWCADDVAF